ncbi:MAG TPA: di-heme oxidoredictase family protein [Longimicrobiales bacterium]
MLALFVVACDSGTPPVVGEPGAPLPALSETDTARFLAGKALFNRIFTQEDGLGPAFNENQCSACHTVPAEGGTTGFERVVKATRTDEAGRCDLLRTEGGENVRTQATPLLRAAGIQRETGPASASEHGRFLPTFLFGLGLVEAIPEDVITARADPDDRDGDGISGRAALGPDGRLARFGRKADVATLEDFTRSALRLEMGLTTRADERDLVNGAPAPSGTDPAPEPEVDSAVVTLLTDFVRFLAPTAPAAPRSPAQTDSVARGRRLFENVGCTQCHTPTMQTGSHAVPALSRRTVQLYSDLLLHDLGPGLANVCAFDADPTELRTAMLMGLQHRSFYLHDGRAIDLRDAILAHGGEARAIRDRFARLPWLQQEYVLIFLRSL